MALPGNEYRVHSDGYTSDRGSVDPERVLIELGNELRHIPGVQSVGVDESEVEVHYDGTYSTYEQIESEATEWAVTVHSVGDEWLAIRPA